MQALAQAERYEAAGEGQRHQPAGVRGRGGRGQADRGRRRTGKRGGADGADQPRLRGGRLADLSGRIGRALVTEGALVGQGEATQLAVVQQIDPLYVNFTQSAAEVLRLRAAIASGQVRRAGGPEARRCGAAGRRQRLPAAGKLLFSDLSVDPSTGADHAARRGAQPQGRAAARAVRARAAGAGGGCLRPSCCRSRRWHSRQQGDTVMVVADGKVTPPPGEAQPRRRAGQWVVLDGLKAGEQVMVDGFQKLRPTSSSSRCRGTPAAAAPAAAAPCRSRRRRAEEPGDGAVLHQPAHLRVGHRAVHPGGAAWPITQLPVAQYPPVAPPSIVVSAVYPGASAQTLEDSVMSVIEREMNGSPGLIYVESVAQADGTGSITLSFEPGTNPDLAQVDVQNRLSRASPRLPQRWCSRACASTRRAATSCSSPSCRPTTRRSTRWRWATTRCATCCPRSSVCPASARRSCSAPSAPCASGSTRPSWSAAAGGHRRHAAIAAQNAQVASGTIGDLPAVPAQTMFATVVVRGQLRRSSSSARSCCAPTPTARPCG
jgi:hypothetical protein